MIPRTRFVLLLALLVITAGCGGHGVTSPPATPSVATVAGATISPSELRTYIRYANRFFSAAYPGTAGQTKTTCRPANMTSACRDVQKQVLARLIQQRVVIEYARSHHLTLSKGDKAQVHEELSVLLDPTSDSAGLFDRSPATRRFLRGVLATQKLVLKVEEATVGRRASQGFTYHIEKISIPSGPRAHTEALDLATDGKPLPLDASVRVEWEAPFRLDQTVAGPVSAAKAGDYVGPFKRTHGYLVVHVLGSGQHAYGRPAKTLLLARMFRTWLRNRVRAAHPRCENGADRAACDLAMMKGS